MITKEKMKDIVCKPSIIPIKIFKILSRKGILNSMSDEVYLKITYYLHFHRKLDFGNPKTFNEKLHWLKVFNHKPEYTMMVDKYEVKKYVADKIGQQYVIPTYGVWDCFDDIDFESLPNQFVLKCTHDSGGVVICKDKSKLDRKKAKEKLELSLKRNYYYIEREWPYKNVKPRIIAEAYMAENSGEDLKDYKLMCFSGKVKCSFTCSNRDENGNLNVNFYDKNWLPMPFERHYPRNPLETEKPDKYEEMVSAAEILAEGIPFVRIDFYQINGRVYFGEITFFPGAGLEEFTPDKWDYILGDWIKLEGI